jgi:hypothetical protein
MLVLIVPPDPMVPVTVSASLPVAVVLGSPCPSCSLAVMLSEKVATFAGIIARPFRMPEASWFAVNVMLPPETVSVLPLVLLSVAPLGMPLIVIDERLLVSPAKSLDAVPRFSAIRWPTIRETGPGATVGASGLTVTVSAATALALSDESFACADKEIFVSLLGLTDSVA